MSFFKSWRRRRALRTTRIDPLLWHTVIEGLPFLRGLTVEELARLRERAIVFLAEKEMYGAGGLELTDEIRLSIALQACLPVLNLGLDRYDGWVGIIVYPDGFLVEREEVDEDGIVHRYQEEASGEAWEGGPVVLSWRDASDLAYSGYNVVIHEFAHKLEMRSRGPDEIPGAEEGMDVRQWRDTLRSAYERFVAQVESGEDTFIDPYAAQHPAEFFAVMSEAFFTASAVMARDWPALYEQLALYYRQDPAQAIGDTI